ncbi:MAG: hypothetical protein ACTSRI_19540 [Promethearchaeota archaeon]
MKSIPIINTSLYKEPVKENQAIINDWLMCLNAKLKKIDSKLSKFSGIKKKYNNILEQITKNKSEIESYDKKLQEISEKRNNIEELKRKRKDYFRQIITKSFTLKEKYDKIIDLFSKGKDIILKEIEFEPTLYFDLELYEKKANYLFHGKRIKNEQITELILKYSKLIEKQSQLEIDEQFKAYLKYALTLFDTIKDSKDERDFYDFIYMNLFSVLTKIKYNKTPMNSLSLGQKGSVMLKLLLAEGDYPLIIDQPEENLDNQFIYSDLVQAVRDAKKNRPIILATHNANLVVNADAEQVIVANYENNKITYDAGSLENPRIKERITTLLEGGKEAFIKRERKYGFNL